MDPMAKASYRGWKTQNFTPKTYNNYLRRILGLVRFYNDAITPQRMSKLVEPLDLFVTIVSTSKLECTYSLI